MRRYLFLVFLIIFNIDCTAQSSAEMSLFDYNAAYRSLAVVYKVQFYPNGLIKRIEKYKLNHHILDPYDEDEIQKNLIPFGTTDIFLDGKSITVVAQIPGIETRTSTFFISGSDTISVMEYNSKSPGVIILDDEKGSFSYYSSPGEREAWLIHREDEIALYQIRIATKTQERVLVTSTYKFNEDRTIAGVLREHKYNKLTTAVKYDGLNRFDFITTEDKKPDYWWYRTDVVVPRIQYSRLSRVLNYFIAIYRTGAGFCLPVFIRSLLPTPIAPVATGTLEDPGIPGRYGAGKAFDGDILTAWVEDRPGPGVGERVGFVSEEPIKADEVRVAPGYFDAEWWAANNRVKKALLHFDGRTVEADFRDVREVQAVYLGEVLEFTRFGLEIVETWPHSRWDDTPVAEIELYYEGERVYLQTAP